MTLFQQAQNYAQSGQFSKMLNLCEQLIGTCSEGSELLLDIGVLLQNFGFVTKAKECLLRMQLTVADDLRLQVNLANIARDLGDHQESRRLYTKLLTSFPNNPVIRRNALVSLEYDPLVTETERLNMALAWGEWAIANAGGIKARPRLIPLNNRPLRIGYVSADFCQHTVGLFIKDVLASHDPARVSVFAYSNGQVNDWVTEAIKSCTQFRDIAKLNDIALAELIQQDSIDVLVDLSGHTGGSRLTVFAYRPAPVQVSWLGYFATTGLSCMDAILLDQWHLSSDTEALFIESILKLPTRFCYQPVPWMPVEISSLPCLTAGYITFGCFNNTAKLNSQVFDVWARILLELPNSRLILKWRTFNDDAFGLSVLQAFSRRGIATERIELRAPSFHVDVLKEYADVDIALDPFPFTGGLTSCEALWMGVPVVTWPQRQVVSRQTFAFLSAMGLQELAAHDANDYVRIAVSLAKDNNYLSTLRASLRISMQASELMNLPNFTDQLEQCLMDLFRTIYINEQGAMNQKTILHVGPGHKKNGSNLPAEFLKSHWNEVRLDIDPSNEPDIVGSMLDMASVESGSVDAIYSAHNIEHVYAHEVPFVLKEFLRVLKPDGFLLLTCPDLQTVCKLVAEDKLNDSAYSSQAGPISPLDILYGHRAALADGHLYMAHKCGFTEKTLTQALQAANFQTIAAMRRPKYFDLWVLATKSAIAEAEIRELAVEFLPK